MPDDEIRLQFTYTEPEFLAASRLLFFRSGETVWRLVLFSLLIVGGLLILWSLVEGFPFWAVVATLVLIEFAMLYGLLVQMPRTYFRGDLKHREPYELTVSERGVTAKTTNIDSRLAWKLYTRMIEGSDVFLLIYGRDIRMMTLIPKRAFKNQEDIDRFREIAIRHISTNPC